MGGCQQGCQMAYSQTKNPNLGKFWRVMQSKMLVYFMAIWSIFRPFGLFKRYLVHISPFGYVVPKNLAILVVRMNSFKVFNDILYSGIVEFDIQTYMDGCCWWFTLSSVS
jgi:hypothetical protein